VVKALRYKPAGRGFDSRWWHNPSGRTVALGSTQPLTEMSTRCISWGKGGRCVRLTTLPPSCAVVMKSGNLNFLEPSGPLQACNGIALLLLYSAEILMEKRRQRRQRRVIWLRPIFWNRIQPRLFILNTFSLDALGTKVENLLTLAPSHRSVRLLARNWQDSSFWGRFRSNCVWQVTLEDGTVTLFRNFGN